MNLKKQNHENKKQVMKTEQNEHQTVQPRLFKQDLKFMDWWHVTNDYLKTTSLTQDEKKEVMIRIHDFSLHLQNTILHYSAEIKQHNMQTYESIESGLKETLRRAKISMARNHRFNNVFAGYWKFLAEVLKNESEILNDDKLKTVFLNFDKTVDALQVN